LDPELNFSLNLISLELFCNNILNKMTEPPIKKQKRKDYRNSLDEYNDADNEAKLPKKKFYRQRAHANPFADHDLT
jgi:hypothetical protein